MTSQSSIPFPEGPEVSLSEEELALVQKAFSEIDSDSNGTIDVHELAAFLTLKWKQLIPKETVESILLLIDTNCDGKLQFAEFLAFQLKYMPLCRGYCKDCKRIILGTVPPDGYICPKCQTYSGVGLLTSSRSFTICKQCYEKEEHIPHNHPYDQFKAVVATRSSLNRLVGEAIQSSSSHLEDSSGNTWYKKNFLRPILEQRYKEKKIPEGGFWGGALDCIIQ